MGENQAGSDAYATKPMKKLLDSGFVLVRGHQYQWMLQGETGFHRKSTDFIVQEGSPFEELLNRRCDGTHKHEQIWGSNKKSRRAGEWTWELAATMLAGACQDMAARSTMLSAVARQAAKNKAESAWILLEYERRRVCAEIGLRPSRVQVMSVPPNPSVQAPPMCVR